MSVIAPVQSRYHKGSPVSSEIYNVHFKMRRNAR